MSGLSRRVCRLETSARVAPDGCPECGLAPGQPVEDYEVEWRDGEDEHPAAPEWCETCGRQTAFVVGWADLEPATPGEGGR